MIVDPSAVLARHLAGEWQVRSRSTTTVTWVNHHSLVQLIRHDPALLAAVDLVGVDGTLLARLCGAPVRSSADQVLPLLLPRLPGARVALLGGEPGRARLAADVVATLLGPGAEVVDVRDGYDGLPADPAAWVAAVRPDVVVVGLGGGRQEAWALRVAAHMPRGLVLTCGGWLDQLLVPGYYPAWAYPLRLNWAVRLAREPRRLWRRYTVEAGRAVLRRRRLRALLNAAPGYERACAVTEPGPFADRPPLGLRPSA